MLTTLLVPELGVRLHSTSDSSPTHLPPIFHSSPTHLPPIFHSSPTHLRLVSDGRYGISTLSLTPSSSSRGPRIPQGLLQSSGRGGGWHVALVVHRTTTSSIVTYAIRGSTSSVVVPTPNPDSDTKAIHLPSAQLQSRRVLERRDTELCRQVRSSAWNFHKAPTQPPSHTPTLRCAPIKPPSHTPTLHWATTNRHHTCLKVSRQSPNRHLTPLPCIGQPLTAISHA